MRLPVSGLKLNIGHLRTLYPNQYNDPEVGFIILRHVNSSRANQYWIHSYSCIRKLYPGNPIVIIDDNSNPEYITTVPLTNTHIVQSEYPGRGELLPYYYYAKYGWFPRAVIIHDSVFIQKRVDLRTDTYKQLWYFKHNWNQPEDQARILSVFNDPSLLDFQARTDLWKGCFGGMSVITHAFLSRVNSKYEFAKMLDVILNRYNRMSFERVLAILLQKEQPLQHLFGDIHEYMRDGTRFEEIGKWKHLPFVKVWTGR